MPSSGAPRLPESDDGHCARRSRRNDGRGFGAHGVRVLADSRHRPLDASWRTTQSVDDADLTQRSVLGMFDVDDGFLGPQRRVGERFFRSAHRLERHAGFGGDANPLVAREACDRFRHLREVVREDDQVLRVGSHAVGVVANPVDVAPQRERVAVGAREHELRVRDPLFDPATVRAAEEPLRCALVSDPRAVAGLVVVLRRAATSRPSSPARPGASTSRRVALDRCGAREQRGVDPHRREERRAHAEPRGVGEDRSRARRSRGHAVGDLEVGQVRLVAVHVRNRATEVPALLVHDAEPGGDQRVVARARLVRRDAFRTA